MKNSPFSVPAIFMVAVLLILAGCQAEKTATQGSLSAGARSMAQPEKPALPGFPQGDSVDWSSVPPEYRPLPATAEARELPGERLGLTGPIVAEGGRGRDAYVAVYDSAGVLVGGILKKEAEENPEALRRLFAEAFARSEIQNRFALERMRQNGALDR